MPYIKSDRRKEFQFHASNPLPQTAGELNYLITKEIQTYIKNKGICYQSYNDVIGALEGAKLELYRRFTAPYEDEKRQMNGDVNFLTKGANNAT